MTETATSFNTPDCPHVFLAINAVQSALANVGIGKDHEANAGSYKYSFRGIDDVYEALCGEIAKNALIITPRVIDREIRELETTKTDRNGNTITSNTIHTMLTIEYDFVSAFDGSKHMCCMVGEAMDTGDKGSNKALSAAYKYMALQAFCIPVRGILSDSESETFVSQGAGRTLDPTGPVKMSAAQSAQLDMEENVRQLANECGFPGRTFFDSPAAKNKTLTECQKLLMSGRLKGPGAKA